MSTYLNKERSKGYIYLIGLKNGQVKVGFSEDKNYKRLINYGPNATVLVHKGCDNPEKLETVILQIFRNKYEIFQGCEYFNADWIEASKLMEDLYYQHCELSTDSMNLFNLIAIKKHFPDYIESDNCQLIKIVEEDYYEYNKNAEDDEEFVEEPIINTHHYMYGVENNMLQKIELFIDDDYFDKLINNNIIKIDTIYNMNDNILCQKLMEQKTIILNVILAPNFDIINDTKCNIQSWCVKYLETNRILNNKIYASYRGHDEYHIDNDDEKKLFLHKFDIYRSSNNDILYWDREYLKKYIPHCIHYDDNNFFVEYDVQSIPRTSTAPLFKSNSKIITEYLIESKHKSRNWLSKNPDNKMMKQIIANYKRITNDKKYINFNDHTNMMMDGPLKLFINIK